MSENTNEIDIFNTAIRKYALKGKSLQSMIHFENGLHDGYLIGLKSAIAHQNQEAVPIYQVKLHKEGWFDVENFDFIDDSYTRIVYLAPPQPQSVKDAAIRGRLAQLEGKLVDVEIRALIK